MNQGLNIVQMKARLIYAISALATVVLGCSRLPAADPAVPTMQQETVADIAKAYKSYKKITDKPVYVNPELARMCVVNPRAIEAARQTKGPHANTAILIYMNNSAASTFASKSGQYKTGAVIVKDKLGPGYRGVGGMVKRFPGFDPAHGDWEYFYFADAANIVSGHIDSCINCHASAKSTDYVFGSWAAGNEGDARQ